MAPLFYFSVKIMKMTDDKWKSKLSPEQYMVMRQKGTEPPFSGKYLDNTDAGTYRCAACQAELFSSDAKYESTTPGLIGWPSFSKAVDEGSVKIKEDNSFGMKRTEVVCAQCDSHLGHVFDETTSETGKHYCINSVCLDFKAEKPNGK